MKILFLTNNSYLLDSTVLENTVDVVVVQDLETFLFRASDPGYTSLILDASCMDTSAPEVCSSLRKQGIATPILVLSESPDSALRVSSLNAGADVVLAHTVTTEELIAQVQALANRFSGMVVTSGIFRLGDLDVDLWKRRVEVKGELIKLSKREMEMLELLILNKNKILSRSQILDSLWNGINRVSSNVVDATICSLRSAVSSHLGDYAIRTVYGMGYVLDAPSQH